MNPYLELYVESSLRTNDVSDVLFSVSDRVYNKHYKNKNKENKLNAHLRIGKVNVFFTVLGCGLVWVRMTQDRLYALIQVEEQQFIIQHVRPGRRGNRRRNIPMPRFDEDGNLIEERDGPWDEAEDQPVVNLDELFDLTNPAPDLGEPIPDEIEPDPGEIEPELAAPVIISEDRGRIRWPEITSEDITSEDRGRTTEGARIIERNTLIIQAPQEEHTHRLRQQDNFRLRFRQHDNLRAR